MATTELKHPPFGVKPAFLIKEARLAEIDQAIARYESEGAPIPAEWLVEMEYLRAYPISRNFPSAKVRRPGSIADEQQRPKMVEVVALIERLRANNLHAHGGTHPDINDAVDMLTRLLPRTEAQEQEAIVRSLGERDRPAFECFAHAAGFETKVLNGGGYGYGPQVFKFAVLVQQRAMTQASYIAGGSVSPEAAAQNILSRMKEKV